MTDKYTTLWGIEFLDLRDVLPHANWTIGARGGLPTGQTLHYNGPPVKNRTHAGEIAQLIEDARWHMRKDAFGPGSPGDGLQYHLAVLSDGTPVQCRDPLRVLWHCANATGNRWSLSLHLPLGGAQDATDAQWAMTARIFEAAGQYYGWRRTAVKGHREWPRLDGISQSACPGPPLTKRLNAWRNVPISRRYRVAASDGANVRTGPGLGYAIAKVYPLGHEFDAVTVAALPNWLHSADGYGFVHSSIVEVV